ncbi:hypothetical protein HGRIS_005532 [Hohenbuehelia grisea]
MCNRPVHSTTTPPIPLPTSTCNSTATPTPYQTINFSNTSWIWTGENPTAGGANPIGLRSFRKNVSTPCENDKCARCATIIAAVDNDYQLYVNGLSVGNGSGWDLAGVHYVPLREQDNVFAFAGINVPPGGPAGFVAKILVHYSDGSTDSIGTDETWRTLPRDTSALSWTSPNFDDSAWGRAKSQGPTANGASLWGAPKLPPALSLADARWIWTSDVNVGDATAPVGTRFFRTTHNVNGTKRAVCATAVIDADDEYTLWVNGVIVGSNNNFQAAKAYHIPSLSGQTNTFAVNASSVGGPAGVIAKILLVFDDGTTEALVTGTGWKASATAPVGFEKPAFDVSGWAAATDVGAFGRSPWGQLAIPAA